MERIGQRETGKALARQPAVRSFLRKARCYWAFPVGPEPGRLFAKGIMAEDWKPKSNVLRFCLARVQGGYIAQDHAGLGNRTVG